MRRQKNLIRGITLENNEWIEDMTLVENCFINYFVELFSSSDPTDENMYKILQHIPQMVTAEMNKRLLAPFKRSEVECALKQMHPTKALGRMVYPPSFINVTGRLWGIKLWQIVSIF